MKKKIIPIFFAVDDNYFPFLSVSLISIKENRNIKDLYKIYILHSGVNLKDEEKILNISCKGFEIKFVNISERLNDISNNVVLRDYYSLSTYYRIFIAELFPEYDKAVYLDSDTVSLIDVAELYNVEINDNLIAGIPDGAVGVVPPFQEYTKRVLGIDSDKYFNAGIICLNLKKLREIDFYSKFNELVSKYKFIVAQDQDCLNVLCKDRVKFLPVEWNVMPIRSKNKRKIENPKIIHYNLTAKPWRYSGLDYEEYFWKYAKKSEYYDKIIEIKNSFTEEMRLNDDKCEKGLIELCITEAESKDNYYNLFVKSE